MKLQANHITFRYRSGGRDILSGFDFSLQSGERVGIHAPSGQGKTTLCKVLAGYEQPLGGEVLLDGKPLSHWKGYCPVQMIWQHPEEVLNPRMKMADVLKEGGQTEPRVLDGLGIQDGWLSRYPQELSGGEMQRFCIARALGKRTRFLLADEITAMHDLVSQSQIWNFLLAEIADRAIGLLVVSHNLPLMGRVCTEIRELGR